MSSAAVRAVEMAIDQAAASDATVLITGEPGAGQEATARLIHGRSALASAAFLTLNCSGIPPVLLESELFGHVRFAFTGAYADKPGLFERASGGTVFLDEVRDLDAGLQARLKQFLDSGDIRRMGAGAVSAHVNVRIISATSREGSLRSEPVPFDPALYARLSVLQMSLPSLRDRMEDLPALIECLLHAYDRRHRALGLTLSSDAMDRLATHVWPGNIRELKDVMERLVLKAAGPVIRLGDLPRLLPAGAREPMAPLHS